MSPGLFIIFFTSFIKSTILFCLFLSGRKLLKVSFKLKNQIITFCIMFFFFFITNIELYIPFAPYIDTKFKEGFTLENYRKITKGMNRSEVELLVGKAYDYHFTMLPDTGIGEKECVLYSQDGNLAPFFDFAWVGMNVCYDENNRVTRTQESIVKN